MSLPNGIIIKTFKEQIKLPNNDYPLMESLRNCIFKITGEDYPNWYNTEKLTNNKGEKRKSEKSKPILHIKEFYILKLDNNSKIILKKE